jgi:glucosamine--fructose-6-phosphate aminotransferase (isomerizing)
MVSFPDPRGRHPFHMHDMILRQPEFLEETIRRLDGLDVERLVGAARRIVVTGCGTSYHAALIGSRLLAAATRGRPAVDAVHAYDVLTGPPLPREAVVVGVSHSGNTPTTNRALARARRGGSRTIGLCGLGSSPMERVAARTVVLGSVHDASWANTMSYTTQLAGFAALARGLDAGGPVAVSGSLRRLPSTVREALATEPAIRGLARTVARRDRVTFLGTGLDEITAQEAALKVRETCSLPAAAYHTEQILHGPFLALDRRDSVVALRSRGDTWRADAILGSLEATGAAVARLGDGPRVRIRLPATDADLRPIVSIVPLQFLAYYAALGRRADPDVMRTDVPRYARGIETLFTWRPAREGSGRRSRPRARSAR